ncbi:uncharacterized protein [Triticum aestivum]|uniref:uncharacterized protein n=1 Tax=Triticum aestivum TaxID=4565 RepID=UPI000844A999|nr:uncharacterized protein LOC123135298 [Triticum aestivum]
MARGKVGEWIRKRKMPRKLAAKRESKTSGASEPILSSKAACESCSSASGGAPAPTSRNAAVSGSRNGAGALPAHSKSRVSSFLSMLMRWRPRVNVMAVLCEQVVYHLMWVVESVVLVGRLCFFLMRFGFKQL